MKGHLGGPGEVRVSTPPMCPCGLARLEEGLGFRVPL